MWSCAEVSRPRKYLGVILWQDMIWGPHINCITSKANQKLGFISGTESKEKPAGAEVPRLYLWFDLEWNMPALCGIHIYVKTRAPWREYRERQHIGSPVQRIQRRADPDIDHANVHTDWWHRCWDICPWTYKKEQLWYPTKHILALCLPDDRYSLLNPYTAGTNPYTAGTEVIRISLYYSKLLDLSIVYK